MAPVVALMSAEHCAQGQGSGTPSVWLNVFSGAGYHLNLLSATRMFTARETVLTSTFKNNNVRVNETALLVLC